MRQKYPMLLKVTYNNSKEVKVLIETYSQLKQLKEDKANIKSIKLLKE